MLENIDYKKMLKIAAESNLPALIFGESGVGKEVSARELHVLGKRKGNFIAVNCGALQNSLADSLLCGHVRGAFTGANSEQIGFIRAANGGTLFLDEIGELSLETQKKFLRILQEKSVVPVGSQKEISVNFRLVCATHRDLQKMTAEGLFREDLYFRISALPLIIPPLRERKDEIPQLAKKFWQTALHNQEKGDLSEIEIDILQNYYWRGNIRQLKNVIERYALLKSYGAELCELLEGEFHSFNLKSCEVNDISPPKYNPNPNYVRPKPTADDINLEVEKCFGNISNAAKNLGISRGSLYYIMKRAAS